MDEFVNKLDKGRFESTNKLWNVLGLGNPWSVGFLVNLIESKPFNTKEEWEQFYYESGVIRNREISKLEPHMRDCLNDDQYDITYYKLNLADAIKCVNFDFGRTKEQTAQKGLFMCQKQTGKDKLTEEECIEAHRFRTICQTWNGVIVRERKAIQLLEQIFNKCEYQKTTGIFDWDYAVDYEMFLNGGLICGLQIKPNSYFISDGDYMTPARKMNKEKNDNYTKTYGVPVFNIAFENGAIINSDALCNIKDLL